MSYTVLARKWRPQAFDEVVGQRHVVQTLQNALSAKRVAHAYLFSGVRGVGKTTVARLFAKALNCEKGISTDICNQCTSCQEIADGISMDVIEIDGASNTGVDDIREIKDSTRYMPSKGRYKVYIIDEVHMLSTNAFNALLKTLEEPPAHVVFILATTEHHKIPLTIISRCQHFNFRRLTTEEIKTKLRVIANEEGMQAPDEAIYLISKEAEGSIRDAQSLLDQVVSYSGLQFEKKDVVDLLGLIDKELLLDILRALVERNGERVLKLIDDAYNFGYDEKRLCQNLIELVRDLSVLKSVKDAKMFLDLPAQEIETLKEIVNSIESEELQLYFKYLSQGLDEISRASYSRIVLEMTFLKIVGLPSFKSLSDILHRLGDLEKMGDVGLSDTRVHVTKESRAKNDDIENKPAVSLNDIPAKIDAERKCANEPPEAYVEKKDVKSSTVKDLGWDGFLKFVFKKKPALGSQLNSATVLSIDDKKVVLGVRKGYPYDYLTDDDAMESLKGLSGSFFKESFSLKIEELSNGVEEAAPVGATLDRGRKLKSGKDKKLKDNFIEDVTEVFGVDIREINEEIV